ncbi:capsular polysaccharide biosynthesis protein [Bacillus sp. NRRL B-14911]|uniref:Glycosyl transferase family 1 n=1 Tax=Bacillus infantis NRRL B-14911 TaxID=1367477 RepID=U5LII5_9BACI|nr:MULTISPECIES: glycosyltransferase family 4 protein [Bacillus]AGX06501.1 hypothetical protein N288_23310 [Bacillus infantis NRRL B-14911]EAR68568.1 capsular polysaccharide biosynthesis protein [Bacillus sp. NRRL B-14911]
MKILFVTTVSSTVDAFLIPHIRLLVRQGHQVDVAFNIIREVNPELIKLGCEIHDIKFQRSPLKKQNLNAYKKIKKIVKNIGYDIIHTHTPIASLLTRVACRKMSNLKILYTAHGFHFFKGAPIKNWLLFYPMEKIAAKYTDAIITMNEEDYVFANKFKLKSKNSIYKIHGVGIELNKFSVQDSERKSSLRREYSYNNEDFILFFAAELNYNKHQDLLINAVYQIINKIPNVKLLLAGEGPLKDSYRELANKFGISDSVNFLGYRNDIPNLLAISDIGVSSSRREGLPVNILEAMATGLPIIATECRGNRDLVHEGENGYILRENDIEGFARAIEELYKSQNLRKTFGENSLMFVKAYSLNDVLIEMRNIYLTMIK